LVLLEAWANAKPVVVADIEVSRRLVEQNGGGVITLFGDSEGLAREIGRLLGDERLRNQLGERGAQAAEAYDGRSLWPRHAEVLERLAK